MLFVNLFRDKPRNFWSYFRKWRQSIRLFFQFFERVVVVFILSFIDQQSKFKSVSTKLSNNCLFFSFLFFFLSFFFLLFLLLFLLFLSLLSFFLFLLFFSLIACSFTFSFFFLFFPLSLSLYFPFSLLLQMMYSLYEIAYESVYATIIRAV